MSQHPAPGTPAAGYRTPPAHGGAYAQSRGYAQNPQAQGNMQAQGAGPASPAQPPLGQVSQAQPPSPEAILEGLDAEQRRVATELDQPMRVLAGAGTGKTRAITHRIAYGIAIGRYVPNRVMALTFTTRAAEEMKVRLRALGAVGVQARTFHSAALRQLRYFWPHAVGGSFPDIIKHKSPLITEAARRLQLPTDRAILRDIAAVIEWAKVSMLTPEMLMENMPVHMLPSAINPRTMVQLYAMYEQLKDEKNMIDFEDILLLTIGIIEDNPELAATIRNQYRHFLVDEYQDVSPLQQRLLDAWLGGRKDICVVGDASQTIYSFTGATSRHLLAFPKKYPGSVTVRLIRDYRSHTEVVELANQLLAARKPRPDSTRYSWAPPLELRSQRGPGVAAEFFSYADDDQEAQGIAEDIADLVAKDGVAPSEIAVLYRTNSQSAAIESALSRANIPYQMRGAEQFFERGEVKQAIQALKGTIAGSDGTENVAEVVRDTLKPLGYSHTAPENNGAVRARWESLAALVTMTDSLIEDRAEEQRAARRDGMPIPANLTLYELVATLAHRQNNQDAPIMEGVTLASIHAAKGLEWDAVFLCGLNEGLLPITFAKTSDEIDEERRLLYVGITRARKYLTFSWSLSRTHGGRGHRKRSRFLDDIHPEGKTRN